MAVGITGTNNKITMNTTKKENTIAELKKAEANHTIPFPPPSNEPGLTATSSSKTTPSRLQIKKELIRGKRASTTGTTNRMNPPIYF